MPDTNLDALPASYQLGSFTEAHIAPAVAGELEPLLLKWMEEQMALDYKGG